MSEKQSKLKAVIGSSNFWTDIVTIGLGAGLGVAGFFHVLPDLSAAQTLGTDVGDTIIAVKSGAWTAIFAAGLKLYNVISHIIKN